MTIVYIVTLNQGVNMRIWRPRTVRTEILKSENMDNMRTGKRASLIMEMLKVDEEVLRVMSKSHEPIEDDYHVFFQHRLNVLKNG